MTTLGLTRGEYLTALSLLGDAWVEGDAKLLRQTISAARVSAKDHCRKSPPKSR